MPENHNPPSFFASYSFLFGKIKSVTVMDDKLGYMVTYENGVSIYIPKLALGILEFRLNKGEVRIFHKDKELKPE